jgi:hypothetical protein
MARTLGQRTIRVGLLATIPIAGLLWPGLARAIDVPAINGHMTDPGHLLSSADKTTIEDKLSKIQADTRVDVAGWIVDAPEDALEELGKDAYRRWNIGNDWDNGVFMVVPKTGRVRLVQPHLPAELSLAEVRKVQAADTPGAPLAQRLDSIAESIGTIIRAKALRARPPGKNDPPRGRWYSAGTLAVLLAAIGLTFRARRRRPLV